MIEFCHFCGREWSARAVEWFDWFIEADHQGEVPACPEHHGCR